MVTVSTLVLNHCKNKIWEQCIFKYILTSKMGNVCVQTMTNSHCIKDSLDITISSISAGKCSHSDNTEHLPFTFFLNIIVLHSCWLWQKLTKRGAEHSALVSSIAWFCGYFLETHTGGFTISGHLPPSLGCIYTDKGEPTVCLHSVGTMKYLGLGKEISSEVFYLSCLWWAQLLHRIRQNSV